MTILAWTAAPPLRARIVNLKFAIPVLKKLVSLSLLSAAMAILAWPPNTYVCFILVFLIPLFYIEKKARENSIKSKFFLALVFLAFFVFYLYSNRWLIVFNKTIGIGVQFLNALFPTITFALFHWANKKLKANRFLAPVIFILCWLSMEIFQFNRDIGFPHMILGNVFAMNPNIIQWYEWTGVIGGSCWVLIINFILFKICFSARNRRSLLKGGTALIFALLLPLVCSWSLRAVAVFGKNIDLGIVHSHIGLKDKLDKNEILQKYIDESKKAINQDKLDYILWPEGSLNGGWMDQLDLSQIVNEFKNRAALNFAIGATLFEKEKASTAGYKKYITALSFDNKDTSFQLRSKYNMVPFSERAPKGFSGLASLVRGHSGKFKNVQHFSELPNTDNHFNAKNQIKPLSLLCYETIFPLTAARGVSQGANVLFIHANEVWFQPELSGAWQTFHYSRIRAIENRRYVARSTNGGVSGFIDPFGKILQATHADGLVNLRQRIQLNEQKTIFSKYGNVLYSIIPVFFILVLLFSYVVKIAGD